MVAVSRNKADLNELSDAALRFALSRALERNGHVESLLIDIQGAVKKADEWVLPMHEETYVEIAAKAGAEYKTVEEYRKYYSYVEEDKQKPEDERHGYLYPHECPFFSEMFLYDLFGKEEARTILALFKNIHRLSSEDVGELHDRANRQSRLLMQAQTVVHYEQKRERAMRYIAALEGDSKYDFLTPKKSKRAYQKDLREANEGLIRFAIDLAHNVQWHFED